MVPQTPTATTTSEPKVHMCGSRAPGTRRATEAHGFRKSHGSYLACLRASNSGTKVGVVSDGELDGNDNAPLVVETVQVGAEWAARVITVVIDCRGSATTAIRVATRSTVGRGERRQRPFSDPSSS